MTEERKASGDIPVDAEPPEPLKATPVTMFVPWNIVDDDDRAAIAEAAAWVAEQHSDATHAAVFQHGLLVPVAIDGDEEKATSYVDAADNAVAACQFGAKAVTDPVFAAFTTATAKFMRTTVDDVREGTLAMWGTNLHTTNPGGDFLGSVQNVDGAVSADSRVGSFGGPTWTAEVVNTVCHANQALHAVMVAAAKAPNAVILPPILDEAGAGATEDTDDAPADDDAKSVDSNAAVRGGATGWGVPTRPRLDDPAYADRRDAAYGAPDDEPEPGPEHQPPTVTFEMGFPDEGTPLWGAGPAPTGPTIPPEDIAHWHAWLSKALAATTGVLKVIQGDRAIAVALRPKDGTDPANPVARLCAFLRLSAVDAGRDFIAAAFCSGDPTPLAHHIMINALMTDVVIKPIIGVARVPSGLPDATE